MDGNAFIHTTNSIQRNKNSKQSTQYKEKKELKQRSWEWDGKMEMEVYMSKIEQGKHVVEVELRWSTRVDATLCLPQSATRL